MNTRPSGKSIIGACVVAALLAHAAAHAADTTPKPADRKFSAGLTFDDKARAADAGLPHYPGAIPVRDEDRDSTGVNLGFWGGGYGLKIVVVKLETQDSVDKVAAFYQPALAEYGPVLDCTRGSADESRADRKSKTLTCERDKSKKNGQLFKSGTRDKQHIVSIRPRSRDDVRRTEFELIYIEKTGTD